jgi:hypothetical protein
LESALKILEYLGVFRFMDHNLNGSEVKIVGTGESQLTLPSNFIKRGLADPSFMWRALSVSAIHGS